MIHKLLGKIFFPTEERMRFVKIMRDKAYENDAGTESARGEIVRSRWMDNRFGACGYIPRGDNWTNQVGRSGCFCDSRQTHATSDTESLGRR